MVCVDVNFFDMVQDTMYWHEKWCPVLENSRQGQRDQGRTEGTHNHYIFDVCKNMKVFSFFLNFKDTHKFLIFDFFIIYFFKILKF